MDGECDVHDADSDGDVDVNVYIQCKVENGVKGKVVGFSYVDGNADVDFELNE